MEGSARDLLEYRKETAGKRTKLALVLLSLLALTAVWRITQGEWAIPLARVAELISPFLSGEELSSPEALVVRSVRLPRFAAAEIPRRGGDGRAARGLGRSASGLTR